MDINGWNRIRDGQAIASAAELAAASSRCGGGAWSNVSSMESDGEICVEDEVERILSQYFDSFFYLCLHQSSIWAHFFTNALVPDVKQSLSCDRLGF